MMAHEITQRVLKRQLQYHLHRTAISSVGSSIVTCKYANKCIQVAELHCPNCTEHHEHVQEDHKRMFVNKKTQTLSTVLKTG